MSADTVADLLAGAAHAAGARPLLTFHDDATGERVELSVVTTANWVAKIGNLLQDELDAGPGTPVATVGLGAHWQAGCVLLAAWSVGAEVRTDPAGAEVAFAAGDRLADVPATTRAVGLSLLPLGAPLPDAPVDVLDFATAVPAHPDVFTAYDEVDPDAAALVVGGDRWSQADLLAAAAGVGGHRVLSTLGYDSYDGIVLGLLGPLAGGGGVVLCRNPDPAVLERRAAQERVTATVGVDLPGLPRLG